MFAEVLNTRLLAALDRPDLRIVAEGTRISFDPTLDTPFRVDRGRRVVLGGAVTGEDRISAFHLRHALELSMLLDAAGDPSPLEAAEQSTLIGLTAARVAARFLLLDAAPEGAPVPPDPVSWLGPMSAPSPPAPEMLQRIWSRIRPLQDTATGQETEGGPSPRVLRLLAASWTLLGPAETLMAEGGDARLAVDPHTGLNHYGCSHRPRPWAVTFASSTASSLSERGFAGAEAARRRVVVAGLSGRMPEALAAEADAVRDGIARHYRLEPGCAVVLAASGTDLEMAALALCCLPRGEAGGERLPVSNVLLAPEETGTGVPMAAGGRHFADDTALGRAVRKGALIEGFPTDTRVLSVAIRDPAGGRLPPDQVDADCIRVVDAEAAAGRRVLLHRLDLSKTGLLAPGMGCIESLQRRLGDRLELVVDACQARLDAGRIRDSLERGWMVMVTGSKFFTGPPFCGALLLPPRVARRLGGPHPLPRGLADYGGASDWPPGSRVVPCAPGANAGMVLRWQAVLAEMTAFASVPHATARRLVDRFVSGVDAAIGRSADVVAVPVPAPARTDSFGGPCWDQVQTIRSFLVLEPLPNGTVERLPLDVARARLVYRWLNADVTRALPPTATLEDRALARLLVHIGQPAPVGSDRLAGHGGPGMAGALRISVGARLLSGEPSHAGLGGEGRMQREIGDVGRVLDKIGLLLRCWDRLVQLDPVPRYAPDASRRRPADPGLDI